MSVHSWKGERQNDIECTQEFMENVNGSVGTESCSGEGGAEKKT